MSGALPLFYTRYKPYWRGKGQLYLLPGIILQFIVEQHVTAYECIFRKVDRILNEQCVVTFWFLSPCVTQVGGREV